MRNARKPKPPLKTTPPPPAPNKKGRQSGEKFWLCGQYKFSEELESTVWEFQGVFSTRDRAVMACCDSNYFITPVVLNEELPGATTRMPNIEYPIANESEA